MGAFDTERNNVLWWMLGPVVIVLLGGALDGMAHLGISAADSRFKLRSEASATESNLDDLRAKLRNYNIFFDRHKQREECAQELDSALKKAEKLSQNLLSLGAKKSTLIADNEALGNAFVAYRKTAIQQVWQEGAGQFYDSLKTTDGKEYRAVVIKRITMEGMEVAHESGRATILYRKLSSDIQSRFRWVEAEQFK